MRRSTFFAVPFVDLLTLIICFTLFVACIRFVLTTPDRFHLVSTYSEATFDELLIGDPAPDFTLPTLNGDTVNLLSLQGQPILLTFWASWCTFCTADLSLIHTLLDQYDEVVAFAINIMES